MRIAAAIAATASVLTLRGRDSIKGRDGWAHVWGDALGPCGALPRPYEASRTLQELIQRFVGEEGSLDDAPVQAFTERLPADDSDVGVSRVEAVLEGEPFTVEGARLEG